MTEKEKRLKEFEKKRNNVEWWTSGEYADSPEKEPSNYVLSLFKNIENRKRR